MQHFLPPLLRTFHFTLKALLATLCIWCMATGCGNGTSKDDTPTSEDTTRYEKIYELRMKNNIPAIIRESERFLSTPRPHTSHLDLMVMYDLAFYKVCNKQQKEGMQIVLKGDSISKAKNDKIMEAQFHYENGRFLSMDAPEKGMPYMLEGEKMTKDCLANAKTEKEKRECSHNVIVMYMNILHYCDDVKSDSIYKAALGAYANHIDWCEREKIYTADEIREGRHDYAFYAFKYAIFKHNRKEAFAIYEKYKKETGHEKNGEVRYMELRLGFYDKVVGEMEEIIQHYRETEDSLELSENYRAELSSLAICYDSLGMTEKAAQTRAELDRIGNAITIHHYNQQLQELNAKYDLQGTQFELDRMTMRKHIYGITAVFLAILGVLGYWGFIHTRRMNRRIRHKNTILARRIDHMVNAEKQKQQERQKQTEEVDTSRTENSNVVERFIQELATRKLYCNPDFDRNQLLDELHLQRRSFVQQFEAYTGTTIAQYILMLRLEYAADLIRNQPNHTIDSIALDSGFVSRSTFYRNFTGQFGITPTEYRQQCMK